MTDQTTTNEYDRRSEALWASIDDYDEEDFRAKIEELIAGLPADSAVAAFERASAFDSTGHPDQAIPLYRRALGLGLEGERRRRAVIQLASSLRNLDQASESVELLTAEREQPSTGSTTPSAGSSRSRSQTPAVSARASRSRLALSRLTCRATSGRWATTHARWWSMRSENHAHVLPTGVSGSSPERARDSAACCIDAGRSQNLRK